MPNRKRKYNVYIRQVVNDYTGDPDLAIKYECFVGATWAVSAAQAANNVRFRRGEKFDHVATRTGEAYYHAIAEEDDVPDLHEGFLDWDKTH